MKMKVNSIVKSTNEGQLLGNQWCLIID